MPESGLLAKANARCHCLRAKFLVGEPEDRCPVNARPNNLSLGFELGAAEQIVGSKLN